VQVTSNAGQLVTQVLAGEVWPPLGDRHGFRVDPDGNAFLLPGMGGVTLGAHCGDPATGYAADHLEPGLSVRHRDPAANYALQYLTCVGNTVVVTSGPAAGSEGLVIGQHAYVLVDMPEPTLRSVTVGDQVTVFAVGQGLALPDHPAIKVKNCSRGQPAAGPRPWRHRHPHRPGRIAARQRRSGRSPGPERGGGT
jgi:hypothetical protein